MKLLTHGRIGQDKAIDNFDLSKSNTYLKIYNEIGLLVQFEKNYFDINS